ncbi:MAG: DPP IV N-terminal domain-containing protein [Bacteroidota bacterium]
MKKKYLFLLLFSGFSFFTVAQNRLLTVEEATHQNPKLNAANLSQLQWIPGTAEFIYFSGNFLIRGHAALNDIKVSPKNDTVLLLSAINDFLRTEKQDTLKKFSVISFPDADRYFFIAGSRLYSGNLSGKNLVLVNSWNKAAKNTDIDKTSLRVAFTVENNLYISEKEKETTITHEQNRGILYGSERVHRNEFGIDKGTFWSPRGNFLAFYRMDETQVTDYPLVDITPRPAIAAPVKYPMAGMTSHKVTVGVYDVAHSKTVYLQTDSTSPPDLSPQGEGSIRDPSSVIRYPATSNEYLTNVTWSPDEKYIYIACLNRDQNHMWMNKYDAVSGRFIKTLFEEKNEAYVEPEHGPHFLNNDPGRFIWESRRNGYNHLYLYTSEGELIRQLTTGQWEVTGFQKTDKKNRHAFFLCNKDNPAGRQLYMVDLEKATAVPLTAAPGTHEAKVSDDGQFILDSYSGMNTARQIELSDNRGRSLRVLLPDANPLKDYNLGKTSIFTIHNEAKTDLYCRMIKPVNFDSTKRYPVIIYVYGGPHSQLVTESWLGGAGLFLNYLADLGYLVFTLDNRGTSNRGRDFEQAIFRNLGVNEVKDQMYGVNYLKSLPYVDSTRIGINGWSYGGFMTLSMFLKYPGTFKVAVCGGPVIDWKYYEVMYGERYMDTPDQNPEGYSNACLLNEVKNLRGKLLIIHDYQDETVVPQNSLMFLKKCVDEGKQVDFFIYPGHEHNVRGKDRVHLNQKIVQYFQDYL